MQANLIRARTIVWKRSLNLLISVYCIWTTKVKNSLSLIKFYPAKKKETKNNCWLNLSLTVWCHYEVIRAVPRQQFFTLIHPCLFLRKRRRWKLISFKNFWKKDVSFMTYDNCYWHFQFTRKSNQGKNYPIKGRHFVIHINHQKISCVFFIYILIVDSY